MEDVIYEDVESGRTSLNPAEVKIFRRLTFERSLGLVQSEALLKREESNNSLNEKARRKNESSKFRKKGSVKGHDARMLNNGNLVSRYF